MIAIRARRARNCALLVSVVLCATMATGCGSAHSGPPTYYVSPSGNDAAAGTSPATAWRTLHKASSVPLAPGGKLLFQGGRRFTGSLIIGKWDKGTAAAPIVIGTYGSGPATLFSPSSNGISVHDTGGVNIENIDLIGTPGPGDGNGINVYNDLPAGHRLNHIDISNVNVTGFMNGIAVSGRNARAGFANVRIANSSLHGNIDAGLATFGPPFNPHTPTYANANVSVSHVVTSENLGNPRNKKENTGSGIVLGSVQDATVSWSVAAKNGGAGAAPQGPGGIWAYDSTGVNIEHNLAYGNKTRDRVDGNGFDLDLNTSHSILQYNLSYGNYGSGFLIYSSLNNGAESHDIIRDNISSYDARSGNSFYGAISIVGYVANVTAYQNTAVMKPTAVGSPPALRLSTDLKNIIIANNIFTTTSGPVVATATSIPKSAVELRGNDYYTALGPWQVTWGNITYGSLAGWQSGTGQETANGRLTGLAVAPQLTEPVFGLSATSPGDLAAVRGFELKAGSPLIGAGLAPASLGVSSTATNYLGQSQSPQHPNIGAT